MIDHISHERMHDLLDGLLSAAEEDQIRAHVDDCPACRSEAAELAEVVASMRSLPQAAAAPDGIWDGIAARIEGTAPGLEEETQVVAFPVAASRRRVFHFSLPQLAAAALVVSVLSAGSVWVAISGLGSSAVPSVASGEVGASAVRPAAFGDDAYAAAALELETIIAQGRGLLAPETITTLEQSLQTIDEAMAEVQAALEADPSSQVLGRMLANHQRSRLRLLRQAASAVQART